VRRGFVILAVISLLVAACGGGSSDEPASSSSTAANGSDQPTATQPGDDGGGSDSASEDQAPPATEADDGDDDSGGEGPSTATVTIGDVTYEATSDGGVGTLCRPDLFGIMAVVLPLADGGDGVIEIIALHEGTDPVEVEQNNRVTVKIGDFDWIADPEDIRLGPDEIALSQVESVEVDGSTVTGTATFVGRDLTIREWVSMTGTFEATCGE